jgi:heme/copper-type cytochrome/quinol oxidase subunit 2
VAVWAALALAPAAYAADLLPGWGQWWLPPDRSTHGHSTDLLFYWIFWITMIIFVMVEIVLLFFLIRYRARADKAKAHFTHGNTRLEMAWTIAPAIILALLALGSKKAWDQFRYSPDLEDPNRAKVLVIGERFKWNVIYPGPDGEFGRYLMYPKPTDLKWPNGELYAGVQGPAYLPYDKALAAITQYNTVSANALGKDFSDPAGKDDIWEGALARAIEIPVNRPVEVQLGSKDVLHDFFLPNYRVKLDAVPGMRGRFVFTAKMTSKQLEAASLRKYTIDELIAATKLPGNAELSAIIPENAPRAERFKPRQGPAYWRYADAEKKTIVRDGGVITPEVADKLKTAGVTEIQAKIPGHWDLVCEELCGEGHATMKGTLIVLSQEEYDAKKWDKAPGAPAPSVAMTDVK